MTSVWQEPVIINGMSLPAGPDCEPEQMRELAYGELLRQQAVRLGLLPEVSGVHASLAPELDEQAVDVIDTMLESEVRTPEPSDKACRRYYEANRARYVVDQSVHLRHILFAVTPRVDVTALAGRAEEVLLSLTTAEKSSADFSEVAKTMSNCPSGQKGGDLGWVTPNDCVPELAQWLFYSPDVQVAPGLHPRLVHTRFGLHIVEILERKPGKQLSFEEVSSAVKHQLHQKSRATALKQYMMLLVGQADVQGIELEGADTPLVQD
ncbi:peptidylprolyl isomerase [Orrella daihaiensis]|uniref:peptidylprolyl isomerase n=2 Tax=Orrella daihaiensis TaxID=2782176 RepID=A0ABY4AU17_9BURK|nr:peptidylprolyl isomerase [Orrella daihaiensis]